MVTVDKVKGTYSAEDSSYAIILVVESNVDSPGCTVSLYKVEKGLFAGSFGIDPEVSFPLDNRENTVIAERLQTYIHSLVWQPVCGLLREIYCYLLGFSPKGEKLA